MTGKLYLCATPIGNLEDITFRVLKTLENADLIAAEDTRHTLGLLNHFDIKTPMTSYHEYNKVDKARVLVDKMREGTNIALVTDAGTPGISDPGEELVRQCYEAGIEVTSVPGPAACITALTMSGLSTRRFCFEAFLPTEKADRAERMRILEELGRETRTIVLYEAPHHLKKTLEDLYTALGDRRISFCRELTKLHETVMQTTLGEARKYYAEIEPRGEFVLVIEGKPVEDVLREKAARWESMSIPEHMEYYLAQGSDRKEAMKQVAKDRGIPKREVYAALLGDEDREE
ncbi:MAG: 16S rRNA (cytidine(1402)-2'-O)-methyltransferase [Clostridium sp.]|nr:16S rRNA (cytidine(1402)-2'-O)-methyltransferase [Clostridium sp.]